MFDGSMFWYLTIGRFEIRRFDVLTFDVSTFLSKVLPVKVWATCKTAICNREKDYASMYVRIPEFRDGGGTVSSHPYKFLFKTTLPTLKIQLLRKILTLFSNKMTFLEKFFEISQYLARNFQKKLTTLLSPAPSFLRPDKLCENSISHFFKQFISASTPPIIKFKPKIAKVWNFESKNGFAIFAWCLTHRCTKGVRGGRVNIRAPRPPPKQISKHFLIKM